MRKRSLHRHFVDNIAVCGVALLLICWVLVDMPGTPHSETYRARDLALAGSLLFLGVSLVEASRRYRSQYQGDQENPFMSRGAMVFYFIAITILVGAIYLASTPGIP